MVDIALSVASKVAEYLVAPVGRHCGYAILSDSYAGQLMEELEKVENVRRRVQHSVDEAQNIMKPIEADVVEWMKEVETVANKAHGVLEEKGRAKKTCFRGWLSNPKERYRLGREAKKTVQAIQALIPRGKFERVYYETSPTGHVTGIPEVNSSASDRGGTITDSRASIFEGIMKALDDEKLKVIGVYGAGGVGKTTLLKEVEKNLRKEGRPFHMIAKSIVSNIPDFKKIQDDIAYAFGLNLKNEPSEVGRRDLLSKRLKEDPTKKVLIILDDLWDKLDLEAIGIPSGDESTECKLLLTSRDKSVLDQKMRADQTFRIEGLDNDEAFSLFEKTVGDRLNNEELKTIAHQVVKKLAGLPLLINSVASTLKYGSDSAWRIYSKKIEESNIETIVKLSYDHLEREETKSLFLLCGLIGGSIHFELLLGLGMGLGLFEGFDGTMEESRDRLNVMLDSLRSACLLLDGGDDKKHVIIHDLYSEAVVATPFRGQSSLRMSSNYCSWSKEKLEKCWAIHLVNVVGDRLVELMRGSCPDLKILMLSQPEDWERGPPRPAHRHDVGDCCRLDFTYKKELRVLYLRFMHIPTLPPSIEILENLQSLYLDKCDVEDVAILGELKALQILSFAGSSISSLPKEIGKLTKLKLLNLSYCRMLQKIEFGVLRGLINLEELHIKRSFVGWIGEDDISSESCNASLAELKSLKKLTTLEISIPDPTKILEDGDLPFENLIRFWINIGNACGREFKGLTTMKLRLKRCENIISKEWVQKTLQKTQYLHLDELREFTKSAHELCSQGFPKLKHLDIRNCSSIKHIVSSSNGAFPLLESLSLKNLTIMGKICSGRGFFSKLKAIRVTKCDQLKYLWSLSQMHRLVQLEEIEVCRCDSMRAIVLDDEGKDTVIAINRVELPNVRRLKLAELPNMRSFCIGAGITSDGPPIKVWFPHLESLVMFGLLDLEKILYSQPSLEYNNLKSIEMRHSKSTSSILKSDWILKLPNLESLKVESSPSAEAVFDLEEIKVTEHAEILSCLTTLRLSKLPNLQRMCKQDVQLQGISILRNLRELRVTNTGMAFLFPVSVAKCLKEIRVIELRDCEKIEALVVDEDGRDEGTNDIIEFPLLKQLKIINCPMIKSFSYFHGKEESVPITSYSQDAYSDSFFDQKICLPSLEELCLVSVGSFKRIWPHELPQSSFGNLAKLELYKCSELLNVIPSTIIERLHNLKNIKIMDCPSLESVFECRSLDSNTTEQIGVLLPKLEGALVSEARRLSHVVKSDSQMVLGLPNLEGVHFARCSSLRYLFPYVMATTLEKLRSLLIEDCEQIKEVVPKEGGDRAKADVMSFPSLTVLCISRCRNFGAFIRNPTIVERRSTVEENDATSQSLFNEMVTLPNLTRLQIDGVQCKELWNSQIHSDSFRKLEVLVLKNCDNLQSIAPSHIWKKLEHCLEILIVISCRSIEIIYESDGTDTNIVKLRNLELSHLEKLRHIWLYDGLSNITFPNLRYIEVLSCPNLEIIFPTFTAEFLGQIETLVVEDCKNMELIADHGECEEAAGTTITFSNLIRLQLEELPKFRRYLPEKYSLEFPPEARLYVHSCGTEPNQGKRPPRGGVV